MKNLKDYSDSRNKSWCIHCGAGLSAADASRDHVPTKTLLCEPLPADLPVVGVCSSCNQSFSANEAHLVALVSSVLAGTTEPSSQRSPSAARILSPGP